MCITLEVSVLGAMAGYTTMSFCFLRNEGTDRGHAAYFFFHGTWQAFDAVLWSDIDINGNKCSDLNKAMSNLYLPLLVCVLCMFQCMFGQVMLLMDRRPLHLSRWTAFKFVSMSLLCYFVMFDEIRSGRCTTIIDMPTLISSRLLEWCDQEFSLKALFVYAFSILVGYDDPAESSKLVAVTRSAPLFIGVAVVLSQVVLFRSLHLSLLCLFCFGMIAPALWGPRAIIRPSKACW